MDEEQSQGVQLASPLKKLEGTPMRYMLLVYGNEAAMSDADRQQCYVDSARLTQELHAKGQYVAAAPLQSVSKATSVRVREGKSLVTDGPFAETREQLGGFYIIEAKDLDEAIAVAARIPPATKGTIEIRPVLDIPGLPEESRR
jgi:hypothetical protein